MESQRADSRSTNAWPAQIAGINGLCAAALDCGGRCARDVQRAVVHDGLERVVRLGRRIRKLSPESKILFVSQLSSADVVEEALGVGAGYVLKAQAGSELLAAVEAVLHGVSSGLAGQS